MQAPAHIFREYDIRGVVGDDLATDTVEAIGRGFVTYLRRELRLSSPVVVLGRDVRPSSDSLRDAMAAGIVSAGAEILDIGVVPTPVLYFAGHRLEADGGVMITGSHNPPEYNGLKLGYRELPLSGSEIQSVYELIQRDDYETGIGSVTARPVTDEDCDMVASKVSLARAASRSRK